MLPKISRKRITASRIRRMAADLILEAEALEAEAAEEECSSGYAKPNAKLLIENFGKGQRQRQRRTG